MNRRELLVAAGGLGSVPFAGCVDDGSEAEEEATTGPGEDDEADAEPPFEIPTIDAPGSRDGTITVPAEGRVTLVNFTRTECPTSEGLLGTIGEARDRLEDDYEFGPDGTVVFLSVTDETRGLDPTPAELADWWREHDGDWPVGIDENGRLNEYYGVAGFPAVAVLDGDGEVRWRDRGSMRAGTIAFTVEEAIVAESSANSD
ncbi:hypothetical protein CHINAEXTREME_19755 [Halobiforma lacisalsi AJ5]|uniref:Redoxin domain-containing protein n=1 Tax=Natronobacterium lacisalsi AJ5 TaxID=358396 RepID=M0LV38_NATLA|nr:TlpA disulfide reductase family protein [Halobiforma lacisalsi]APW99868.1 hypothetical protein CHINAEXTREME_19755 [Halobiforma lacisalsi AJ5]EMA35950.1 hypothetical protein C445_03803 [Halobiforma lacisalsi AJ5]